MNRLSVNACRCSILVSSHLQCNKLTVLLSAACMSDNAGSTRRSSRKGQQEPNMRKGFPQKIKSDWIGPPDPLSNLRLIKFYVPDDETAAERKFRLMREDTQNWNQAFWSKHNTNYTTQKNEFIEIELEKLKINQKLTGNTDELSASDISAETMAKFYKKFLDDNYELHQNYNKEWYKRNLGLLWLAFKVQLERLFRRRRRHNAS